MEEFSLGVKPSVGETAQVPLLSPDVKSASIYTSNASYELMRVLK
jgi:hypothetical protein